MLLTNDISSLEPNDSMFECLLLLVDKASFDTGVYELDESLPLSLIPPLP